MPDYIDREAAYKALNAQRQVDEECWIPSSRRFDSVRACAAVASVPAADVAPVKRGKWLISLWHGRRICSVCSWETDEMGYYNPYQFCPRCGAKMEVGE